MTRASLVLILSALFLFSIGITMVFNTTSAEIIERSLGANTHAALLKQLVYAAFGIFFGIAIYLVGYEKLISKSYLLLGVTTALLLLIFIPSVGLTLNGARRWISFFGFSFQPSECVKVFLPAAYLHWFFQEKKPIELTSFLKMLSLLLVPVILIFIEPDNGSMLLLLALLVVLFFLTKIQLQYWATPLLVFLLIGGAVASRMPHVPDRIRVYLHPELDLKGKGHQPHQAKIAAGSGRVLGRGFGESLQKLNYLPEARSDYIAAIFAEETGFVGMVVLIGVYAVFGASGFWIAARAKDSQGFYLASIFTFLILIQTFLNLGIVSGLLPSKGMTLPFFSQGGSSLVINTLILFLLLDIGRKAKKLS